MSGRVVHCKREPYDVYIGRPGKWGNPFAIGKDGTRDEVCAKYEGWIRDQPELLKALPELKDKVLGCWCAPKRCHGDILLKLIEEFCLDTRNYVIGADEVGRGPLAGGCYVGAVMAPVGMTPIEGVTDSKKLTPRKRERLHKAITSHEGLHHRIAIRTASRVDDVGIQKALLECFWEAIEGLLALKPQEAVEVIRIDGKPIGVDFRPIPTEFIIKGDAKDWVIGAASIVAKVERDAYMVKMAQQYPEYGWEGNKGYGSQAHIAAIKEHGLTPLHRQSFCRNFVDPDDIGDILELFGGE